MQQYPARAAEETHQEHPRRSERDPQRKTTPEAHAKTLKDFPDVKMERFRIAVGYRHGVKPGNIVGAISNEAEIEGRYIGHIEIYEDYSTVDLPAGMPPETFNTLRHTWVCKQKLAIERLADGDKAAEDRPRKPKKLRADRTKKPAHRAKGTEKPKAE